MDSTDWTDLHNFPSSPTSLADGAPIVDNDVFAVRTYLSYFVPIEIADIILSLAIFWPCSAVATEIPRKDRRYATGVGSDLDNNTAAYYMVTPAIPSGHTAIQAVRFTLLSHDQGQAEALGLNLGDNFRGTYQGSHTWFEAAIIRDDREEFPRNLIPTDELEDIDAFNRDALSREHAREIRNPLKAGTMERWEVQYNVQAVYGIPKMHQVVWMKDDVFNDEVETAARSKGARTGRGFVSMLRPGDRVALVIRAQYHGWRNFIYGAKIEIFHAV